MGKALSQGDAVMMKFRNMALKYYGYQQEAGNDGGEGGGGEGSKNQPDITNTPEFKAALEAGVSGLRNKNDELLGNQKKLKEQLTKFEGIDPEAVRTMLSQFASSEEVKLLAEGKFEEVLDKRTTRIKESNAKREAELLEHVQKAEGRAEKFTQKVLENHVRGSAITSGVHASAVDDALYRARELFTIDEDGNAIAKENVCGKDGKPLTLNEWFGEMKEKAPHWFPAVQGSGGGEGGQGKSGAPSSYADCKTDDERVAFLKNNSKG